MVAGVVGRRVLVADDDADIREVVSFALQKSGYDVRCAASGADCLAMAAEWEPDVVLLDIGMPKMNGHETAARLRQLDLPTLRLIALTGSDPLDAPANSVFDAYALKPFGLKELLRTVEDVIVGSSS
jgi:CheY-like chemotaxis protein